MIAPIALRELLVASRQPASWRIRLATTFCGFLIALVALVGASSPASAGQGIFNVLTFVVFVYAAGAGFILTADCIGQERREGTFGLLYLTPLSSWDVIVGKLASNSLQGVFGLVAIVPMLFLSVLAGGVKGQDVFRVVIVLLATLFLSLSAGIFASAAAESRRTAIFLTSFLMISPMVGGWIGVLISTFSTASVSTQEEKGRSNTCLFGSNFVLAGFLMWMVVKSDQTHEIPVAVGNPVAAVIMASIGTTQSGFLISAAAILATGLFYLFCATLCTEWYREVPDIGLIKGEEERPVEDVYFPGLRSKGRVGDDPAAWLLTFLQSPPFLFYIAVIVMALISLGHGNAPGGMGMGFAFLLVMIVPYVLFNFTLARFCAAPFYVLERSGFLETLMTTPVRTPELARAQRRIFWKTVKIPFVGLVLASVPTALYFVGSGPVARGVSDIGIVAYAVNWIAGWLVFALHLETLAMVAMWQGIRGRKPLNAAVQATAMMMLPELAMNVLAPVAWNIVFGWSFGMIAGGYFISRLLGQIVLAVFFYRVLRSVKGKIGLWEWHRDGALTRSRGRPRYGAWRCAGT